ncbi:MAG: BtpA/SgcQ family protein [Planctomycetes bacterium]|nr:BtpA/SgcQ family protein [Planctomycetota bacterium]
MTREKPILGVVHLKALPSAPRARLAFPQVLELALADAKALADGGVDGIFLENFGDAPFCKGTRADPVAPDVPAALAVVAREVRLATSLPVGINCLRNDAVAALGAAVVAGASWVRVNVLTGAAVTDQGILDAEAERVLAYRRRVGASARILADLFVKHAQPLAPAPLADAARDLAERSGADGLILTGARTGAPVDPGQVRAVRAAVGAFPIWIGSGLDPDNAATLLPLCDGAIVGTWFKVDGRIDHPVDPDRVRKLTQIRS